MNHIYCYRLVALATSNVNSYNCLSVRVKQSTLCQLLGPVRRFNAVTKVVNEFISLLTKLGT